MTPQVSSNKGAMSQMELFEKYSSFSRFFVHPTLIIFGLIQLLIDWPPSLVLAICRSV